MPELTQFQKDAINYFGDKIIALADVDYPQIVTIEDFSHIEKTLIEIAKVGKYTNVDFTQSKSFDSVVDTYRKNNFLYIEGLEKNIEKYLKFIPSKMVINVSDDPRYNHLVIQTKKMPIAPDSVLEEGIQLFKDRIGTELKPIFGKEKYNLYLFMCKPGRIVLHPKGSVFRDKDRKHYFQR